MSWFWPGAILLLCIWRFDSVLGSGGGHCRGEQEYLNNKICCLKCPPGTRLIAACSRAGERGTCEECMDGTYMQFFNIENKCLTCKHCDKDHHDVVRSCSHTLNAECQCKKGTFCLPDQPCEVCLKCTKCNKGEEVVRECTPTANTVCKKITDKSDAPSGNITTIVVVVLVVVLMIVVIVVVVWKYRNGCRRNQSDGLKDGQPNDGERPPDDGRNGESQRLSRTSLIPSLVRPKPSVHLEEERKVLCESLSSSASNSQHSLNGVYDFSFRQAALKASVTQPTRMWVEHGQEPLPQLVAVNGEESLRKCFTFFEDMSIEYHKRFFRLLDISDNVMASKEPTPYEDRIHDYLNIWIEKRGLDASLNELLKALLEVNQRRTAERIMEKALCGGLYQHQE